MKKLNNVLWGIVLVAVGVVWALDLLGIMDVNIFFKGWWTMFIIIPCAIGIFTQKERVGNIIGVVVGVFLLLCCQDILSFGLLWKLLVPAIIVIVGIKLIFGSIFDRKTKDVVEKIKRNGKSKEGTAIFSSCNLDFKGETFEGATLNSVFGGIKCDLREAVFEGDCVIDVSAIFGGIDIFLPDNVNVKINSTSIFGGISNKKNKPENASVTVYISGTCMFGGVDIK